MQEETVLYLGNAVPRRGFRAFIFNVDGKRKLVESWDEFELFTYSDDWFATKEEAEAPKKPLKKITVKSNDTGD